MAEKSSGCSVSFNTFGAFVRKEADFVVEVEEDAMMPG